MRTPARFLLVIFFAATTVSTSQAGLFCSLSNSVRRIITCKEGTSMKKCREIAQAAGCSVVRELRSINAVVITVPAQGAVAAETRLMASSLVDNVEEDPIKNWIKNSTLGDFSVPSVTSIIGDFRGRPRADLTPVNHTAPEVSPRAGAEIPWGVARLKAPAAWQSTIGKDVKVAVIDTGIDKNHPDLPNVAGGANVVNPEKPGDFSDEQGHGTHVSGTIGANGAILGVAPGVQLYGVKVLDAQGNGTYSDVIAGIEWAVDNGMDVANMSLGADEDIEALHRAVIAATNAGLTIVAAAGNSGGAVSYPGAYPEVITVSASDKDDKLAWFSSRGPSIDTIAPGVAINSTFLNGDYAELNGTSMATPHVTGLAALAVSMGAHGRDAVYASLENAANLLEGLEKIDQGFGMVDAGAMSVPLLSPQRPISSPWPWPWGLPIAVASN